MVHDVVGMRRRRTLQVFRRGMETWAMVGMEVMLRRWRLRMGMVLLVLLHCVVWIVMNGCINRRVGRLMAIIVSRHGDECCWRGTRLRAPLPSGFRRSNTLFTLWVRCALTGLAFRPPDGHGLTALLALDARFAGALAFTSGSGGNRLVTGRLTVLTEWCGGHVSIRCGLW